MNPCTDTCGYKGCTNAKSKSHSWCEPCRREYQRMYRARRDPYLNCNVTTRKTLNYLKKINHFLDYGNLVGAKLKIKEIENEIITRVQTVDEG